MDLVGNAGLSAALTDFDCVVGAPPLAFLGLDPATAAGVLFSAVVIEPLESVRDLAGELDLGGDAGLSAELLVLLSAAGVADGEVD